MRGRRATDRLKMAITRCLQHLVGPDAGVEHYAGRTSASPAIAGPLMTLPGQLERF